MSDAPTEAVEGADAPVSEVSAEVSEQQPPAQQPASGSQEQPEAPAAAEEAPYWPQDWREKMAEHYSAGNQKAYDRELRRLQRITDPTAVYGSFREGEARWDQGGLIKVPGEGATDEEIAAYDMARGVPEEAAGYFENLELSNGVVIGDADMPMAEGFAEAAHEAGMDPYQFQAVLDWYYSNQEQFSNELDELDDQNRINNDQVLREEFGGRRKGLENSVPMLFAQTPGGGDPNNDASFMNNLFGGRLGDGTRIIDSPDFNRWVFSLTNELHPRATLVEYGAESGKSIEEQLKEIRDFRRSNRHEYNRDEAMQQKERDLLDAQMKAQERERSR
jgi:hypothetical protein